MAHTPGPWRVQFGASEFAYEVNQHTSGLWSAVAEVRINQDGSRPVDAHEAAANAQLIASAPELLDALRGSLAFLEWASEWRERDATAVDQEIAFEIRRITQAIAEAEGRGG